jgi:hypothetical protein
MNWFQIYKMKNLSKSIFYILIYCFLFPSCRKQKNEEQLPAATQSGTNTFGCLLDGKAWIPTGGGIGSGVNPTRGGFFQDAAGKLNIYIAANSYNDYIEIYLKHIISSGIFYLNSNTDTKPNVIFPESYGAYFIRNASDEFVTDSLHTGTVNITYADTAKGIVSGTFVMNVYNKNTREVKSITEGRFDYKNH